MIQLTWLMNSSFCCFCTSVTSTGHFYGPHKTDIRASRECFHSLDLAVFQSLFRTLCPTLQKSIAAHFIKLLNIAIYNLTATSCQIWQWVHICVNIWPFMLLGFLFQTAWFLANIIGLIVHSYSSLVALYFCLSVWQRPFFLVSGLSKVVEISMWAKPHHKWIILPSFYWLCEVISSFAGDTHPIFHLWCHTDAPWRI